MVGLIFAVFGKQRARQPQWSALRLVYLDLKTEGEFILLLFCN